MLNITLMDMHKVDITQYPILKRYLKKLAKRYETKQAKTLTADELLTFLMDFNDADHLLTKVSINNF